MTSPWWTPERYADRQPFLRARARIKSAIRTWFEAHGFIEVDTACLQMSPGNETHLHAFKTQLIGTDLAARDLYLHTSPEFAMKKLLAAGEGKIFTFAPCFRNREHGAAHSPEFMMLEWYRANETYDTVAEDSAALLKLACETTGQRLVSWRGATADPGREPERLTVAAAFARHAGIDLLASAGAHPVDRDRLAAMAHTAGVSPRDCDTWSDIFARVLAARVEPKLGIGQSTLLIEYPTTEAALAQPCAHDPHVAERFELYCCGLELANGFGELNDAVALHANLEAQMTERQRIYGERYPIDEDFIAAVAHMPPAAGCALGFDRLVMLATGATRIDQVQWTPAPQPR
jgi:elongation factor P--(R)-beta-lysine ligase